MWRKKRITLVVVVGLLAGCDDDNKVMPDGGLPPCPTQFAAGELCDTEGLDCPFPQARCESTRCTCDTLSGILRWECRVSSCTCTCACERTVTASCEVLGCPVSGDPCPSDADDFCAIACRGRDAGGADGGAEAGADGSIEAGGDAAEEAGADATADSTADAAMDTRVDVTADSTVDARADQALDVHREAGRDNGPDVNTPPNDFRRDRGGE